MTRPLPGWTLSDWQDAYNERRLLPEALNDWVAGFSASDPAWIKIADPQHIERQTQALAERLQDRGGDRASLPLYGVPFAVKDNIDVAGWPTTAACPAFAYSASETAVVVQRLQAAGAILVGKTNMDQFATGLNGTRSPYGAVPNSFDARYISGGSSSGSASVVARGLVPFALGTDTAGSGRVPAGFNNIVGLKPTRGWWSMRGVLPACQSLDCVSTFTLTVTDAWQIADIVGGFDPLDPYARKHPERSPAGPGSPWRLAIPDRLEFFGDMHARDAFARTLVELKALGAQIASLDFSPFQDLAELLYGGPWVAERTATLNKFLKSHPEALEPTLKAVFAKALTFTAQDAFEAEHHRASLSRLIQESLKHYDALIVPTAPGLRTCADLMREPLLFNNELGTYTNFVNLADLCALAVPGPLRSDGLPAGVTFIAPAWHDQVLVVLAHTLEQALDLPLGATGRLPSPQKPAAAAPRHVRLAVVGAHMQGMPLNESLTARHATFVARTRTAACYRLYALNTTPSKPCLVRDLHGSSIEVEVWDVPVGFFGALVAEIPPPLSIGSVLLNDGQTVKGFLGESYVITGLPDITAWGGWRAYLKQLSTVKSPDGIQSDAGPRTSLLGC